MAHLHCRNKTRIWTPNPMVTLHFADIYRPQRSCGQGNIFTPVCHSVHRGGSASVHVGIPPPPRIRSTSGRYASYWNAFLFHTAQRQIQIPIRVRIRIGSESESVSYNVNEPIMCGKWNEQKLQKFSRGNDAHR